MFPRTLFGREKILRFVQHVAFIYFFSGIFLKG